LPRRDALPLPLYRRRKAPYIVISLLSRSESRFGGIVNSATTNRAPLARRKAYINSDF